MVSAVGAIRSRFLCAAVGSARSKRKGACAGVLAHHAQKALFFRKGGGGGFLNLHLLDEVQKTDACSEDREVARSKDEAGDKPAP